MVGWPTLFAKIHSQMLVNFFSLSTSTLALLMQRNLRYYVETLSSHAQYEDSDQILFVCLFMWWAGVTSLTESLQGAAFHKVYRSVKFC